jgi:mRNA interferase RelE/StbE
MSYRIVFDKPAEKDFRRLPKDVQQGLANRLSVLTKDPRPPDSLKLKGADNCYRLRHGSYRLVYTVLEDHVIVLVLRVGHRSSAYSAIPNLSRAIRKHRRGI